MRLALLGFLGTMSVAGFARADITPPPRAKITLELTVEGQASVPHLKFFVTNCDEEPEKSVVDASAPLTCQPKEGPMRVYGFREGDLIELFQKIRDKAGNEESAKFLRDKAKTCGEIEERDRVFRDVNVTLVKARYAIEKRDKDSCRLKRIAATSHTRQELQSATPSPEPAPSASGSPATPPVPPAPSPSSEVSVGRSTSCSCELAPASSGRSALSSLGALGFALVLRRRPRSARALHRA